MKHFVKKPVKIQAIQYTKENCADVMHLLYEENHDDLMHVCGECTVDIETIEGTMIASPGDWIIRGVRGELYPCKPDIFEETYFEVEAEWES